MSGQHINLTPISRARAKIIADLGRASARRKHGLFRIEGWRSLASAISAGVQLEDIVVRSEMLDDERMDLLRRSGKEQISTVGSRGMARLSSVLQDQGVAATAPIQLGQPTDLIQKQRLLALDGVQDPGNVGTLIRTAAWFGIDAVLADVHTADFFNPKVIRAAAGALWDPALVRVDSMPESLDLLKRNGFSCFGAEIEDDAGSSRPGDGRAILVLGSEGHGLSDDVRPLMDGFVHIEGRHRRIRGVESLNVAVAGSILIARWMGGVDR